MAHGWCRGALCAVAIGSVLVVAAPAGASVDKAGADLTGCKGSATSKDKGGGTTDTLTAPGPPGSSKDNPFHVDFDGTISYDGSSNAVITDHHWEVRVFGAPVKSGGSKNSSKETASSDTVKVKDYLRIKSPGLYYVSGELKGTGGSCTGNVWVKVDGSPTGTAPWVVGIVFTAGGLLLLFFALPTVSAAALGAWKSGPGGPPGPTGPPGATGPFSGGAPMAPPPPGGMTPPEV